MLGKLGQYHGCWCADSLCHQVINSHGILSPKSKCFHWERISTWIMISNISQFRHSWNFNKKSLSKHHLWWVISYYQALSLQWCHNERGGISHHRQFDCLLSHLRHRAKKTSKLCVTDLCEGNSPVNSPHKGPVMRKMFPFDDVIINH